MINAQEKNKKKVEKLKRLVTNLTKFKLSIDILLIFPKLGKIIIIYQKNKRN